MSIADIVDSSLPAGVIEGYSQQSFHQQVRTGSTQYVFRQDLVCDEAREDCLRPDGHSGGYRAGEGERHVKGDTGST